MAECPAQIAPIKPAEVPGSWLTGISEVQLPAHYKLKNIEETEAVKKRMLQGGHDSACAFEVPASHTRIPDDVRKGLSHSWSDTAV